jgi:hypothetical protein
MEQEVMELHQALKSAVNAKSTAHFNLYGNDNTVIHFRSRTIPMIILLTRFCSTICSGVR